MPGRQASKMLCLLRAFCRDTQVLSLPYPVYLYTHTRQGVLRSCDGCCGSSWSQSVCSGLFWLWAAMGVLFTPISLAMLLAPWLFLPQSAVLQLRFSLHIVCCGPREALFRCFTTSVFKACQDG